MREHRSADLFSVAPCTLGILGLCIVMYIITIKATADANLSSQVGSIPVEVLLQYGGYIRQGIWDNNWQRFVMPLFLHANILHILFNMVALYRYGPSAEMHFGSQNFFSIYFLSGILGICIGLIFGEYSGPGIGASGAVFGIMGSFLAIKLAECHDFRRALKNSEVHGISMFIAINFFLCFLLGNVDHWGHLGGLVAGTGYGFMFEIWRKRKTLGFSILILSLLVTVGAILGSRWMVWNPHYYIHQGLAAEERGRDDEAIKFYEIAVERGKFWRSQAAVIELLDAANIERKRGNVEREERYYALIPQVAPKKFLLKISTNASD